MTKPYAAIASTVATGAAIALAWNAIGTDITRAAWSAPLALGFHYVGGGIRRKEQLAWGDHKAALPLVWDALAGSHQEAIAPIVTDLKTIPGIERVTTPELDLSEILTHSAAFVAPSKTGKSFFLSLVMAERQRRFPNAPFVICSVDTWGRGHTWMGLADCPRWLKLMHIRLGFKYEQAVKTIDEAIHLETIDCIDSLYNLMQLRSKQNRDGNGKVKDFEQSLLIVDEFAQFMTYVEDKGLDDVKKQIKSLLIRGSKYQTLLYVISQDEAVNMMGIPQSEKKQLVICSLFQKDVTGTSERNQLINSVKGRRVLFEYGGQAAIAPIPHLDSEPQINWSQAIEMGQCRGWLDELRPVIDAWKKSGETITNVWDELTNRVDFPGNKRQGKNNPDYEYFVETIWR